MTEKRDVYQIELKVPDIRERLCSEKCAPETPVTWISEGATQAEAEVEPRVLLGAWLKITAAQNPRPDTWKSAFHAWIISQVGGRSDVDDYWRSWVVREGWVSRVPTGA